MKFEKLYWFIKSKVLFVHVITQSILYVPLYVIWYIILQPVRLVSVKTYQWLLEILWDSILCAAGHSLDLAGHRVHMFGDNWKKCIHDEAVLLLNHQGMTDVVLPMRIFHGQSNNYLCSRIRWIADWIVKFSYVGFIFLLRGDFFLVQKPDAERFSLFFKDDLTTVINQQQRLLQENIIKNFSERNSKWILLFPEGGFLSKRKAGSQRYAAKNNLPILEHVCLPRIGCFNTIINTLGIKQENNSTSYQGIRKDTTAQQRLKWIVDLTVAYKEKRPMNMVHFFTGSAGPKNIYIYVRVIPASNIIDTAKNLEDQEATVTKWLQNLFIEKNQLLKDFYKYGQFKTDAKKIELPYNWGQYVGIHIFLVVNYIALFQIFF